MMTAVARGEMRGGGPARRSRSRRPAPAQLAGFCVFAAFVAAAVTLSGYALWNEIVAAQAEALATDAAGPGGSPASDIGALEQVEHQCLIACPPRVLDAASAVRLAAAAPLSAAGRAPLVERADRDLTRAAAAEPLNGAVAIHRAYAAALAIDARPPAVLTQIERSYETQAYSGAGGLWRMGFVAHNWALASPNLKRFVLNEALWLPLTGVPAQTVTDLFESAGLGLQLDLARHLPPV